MLRADAYAEACSALKEVNVMSLEVIVARHVAEVKFSTRKDYLSCVKDKVIFLSCKTLSLKG